MPYIADIPERVPWAYMVKVKYLGPTSARGARLKAYVRDMAITEERNTEPTDKQAMKLAVKAVIAYEEKLDKAHELCCKERIAERRRSNMVFRLESGDQFPAEDSYYFSVRRL